MKFSCRAVFFLIAAVIPVFGNTLEVGVGKADITPTTGTPSAGYTDRQGEGMEGCTATNFVNTNLHNFLF